MGSETVRAPFCRRNSWLTLSRSETDGDFTSPSGDGGIESSMSGVFPYLRYAVSDELAVYGAVGYGEGHLRLVPEAGGPLGPDTEMRLASFGVHGDMLKPANGEGSALAFKAEALLVKVKSEETEDLPAAKSVVTRQRLGLEWRRRMERANGASLTPSVEISLRHDAGDGENGLGVDLGGGVAWANPESGLSGSLRLRGLLAHEEPGANELGVVGSLRYDTDAFSDLGPSLTLVPSWGEQRPGSVDAARPGYTLAGEQPNAEVPFRRSLKVEFGYGFPVLTAGSRARHSRSWRSRTRNATCASASGSER